MTKMWEGWTIGILGAWLALAAFLPFTPRGNTWDDLIVGAVAAIVGFMIVKQKPWQGRTAGIAGVWLLIAAFIPQLVTHNANLWNGLIVGLVLMIAGFGALGSGTHKVAH